MELTGAPVAFSDRHRADWACDMLVDNLARDSVERACLPSPRLVLGVRRPDARRVSGRMYYLDIAALPYSYDVGTDADGRPLVTIRMAFTGALASDARNVVRMQNTLDEAASIWTRSSRGGARFRFVAVDSPEQAHFQLELSEGCPRAPFNVSGGLGCPAHVLAHEAGHMLGLDDEYNQILKTTGHVLGVDRSWDHDRRTKLSWFHCGPDSIMCDSRGETSVPQPYHYYVILRRLFCPQEETRHDSTSY